MKPAAIVLLCLALVAGESAAGDRALLIGIGNYRIAEANLPGVDEDLIMMREVARTLGFADSQVKVLADSQATLQGIREAVSDWLVDQTSAGDRVLFYHSGHGSLIADADGDEDDGSDEALLPYDFQETAIGGEEKRLSNVLLDDELGRLLARIPAREVVALVDSCHSGTMTRSAGGRWTSKFYRYRGIPRGGKGSLADRGIERRDSIILLSAARPEEEAQTSERGALFTQGVWKAVREAAPRQRLTIEQLQTATENFIRQEVGEREEYLHQPMLTGGRGLRSINLFLPPGGSQVAEVDHGTASPSPPLTTENPTQTLSIPSPVAAGDLWNQLEILVRDAGQALSVTAGKAAYRAGELLELTVTSPRDGYLHILNVGDGEDQVVVLFPNRYQTDNRVRRGETVRIPSVGIADFNLPARLPPDRLRQKNLVVAVQTSKPLFSDGTPASTGELFRVIRRVELTRSISRIPVASGAYSAGQVVVTIGL